MSDFSRDRDVAAGQNRIVVIGPSVPGDGAVGGIMLERTYGAIPDAELVGLFADDSSLFAPGKNRDGSRLRSLMNVALAPLEQVRAVGNEADRVQQVVAKLEQTGGAALIIGVTGAVSTLSLANQVAKRMGVAFVAHIFDDCVYQWMNPLSRVVARRLVVKSLREAAAVVVHNEILAAAMTRLAGVDTVTLRNPVPDYLSMDGLRPGPSVRNDGDPLRLLYTGNIYDAQFGAIRNFVEAVEMLAAKDLAICFDIYTRMPKDRWSSLGIRTDAVSMHEAVNADRALELQRSADLLALPLSFSSRYPRQLIDSSAPGKFGEYLASGTPMLVHAPPTSFPSVYCRDNQCGIVADVDDAAVVAAKIEESLFGGDNFIDEVVANATRLAAEEFAQGKVSQKAAAMLSSLLAEKSEENFTHS